MSRRVFLVTRSAIQVFEWDNKVLLSCFDFSNDEEGSAAFEFYLSTVRPKLSHILVELLDEDFQRETIPYVMGPDKKRLIERQLNRHYRDKAYTCARILGRDSEGRKDEELLLTCISNPEPLDYWLALMNKHRVPVVGIWSLPLLSADLLKKLPQKNPYVLLVSRQMRSTLRESFFRHKKLLLSRQVTLDSKVQDAHDPQAYLTDGVAQMHKFLGNQRIIPFGKPLDVLCLLPEDLLEQAKREFHDSDIIKHHFFSLEHLLRDYGIVSPKQKGAEVLYAYLCSLKPLGSDHYSTKGKKQNLWSHVVDRCIFYSSTVGSLMLFLLAALLYISSLDLHQQAQVEDQARQRLASGYASTYLPIEHQITATDMIRETVHYADKLKLETGVSPENLLIPLGQILGDPQFERVSLTALHWRKTHGNALETLRNDVWKKNQPPGEVELEYPYNEEEMDDKLPFVVLHGEMQWDNLSYRETVDIMQRYVGRLRALPGLESLVLSKTPVDIRSQSHFSDNSGTDTSFKSMSDEARHYEIMLLFKPVDVAIPSGDGSGDESSASAAESP